ncbi:Metalloendopeptidase OMA1, mitochondrial [Exaiptasia diaphana]|nr:Metalloendopeptidase OMA1, mitochondrial [Exaiptasia diaphana]
MVAGRTFRKLNPKYKQMLFTEKRTEKLIIIAGAFGGLSVAYYFFHLEQTPFTRRVRFMPLGNAQMEQIIESEYKQALEVCGDNILPVNHPDHIRVFQVTKRLVTKNQCKEMEGIKWQVNVVDTPDMNAFVLPNGQIFMFKGMLDILPNDSALATILGHEMAHAILKHGAEQASLHGIINLFIVISLAILWAILPTDFLAISAQWFQDQILTILLHLPYSRTLEEEADEVGMLFAAKACFDVRESPKLWERLAVKENMEGTPDAEWLSTHPSHTSRASNLDSLLPEVSSA